MFIYPLFTVFFESISSTGLKLLRGRVLAGCSLYCVLSSEQWEGGGPGSPEGSDLRPQPEPLPPASSVLLRNSPGEVMGLCALAPKKNSLQRGEQ